MTKRPPFAALLAACLAALALVIAGCSGKVEVPDPAKPHHTSAGFRNADGSAINPGVFDGIRYSWAMWNATRAPLPPELTPRVPDLGYLQENRAENSLTWIGHSTVLLQVAGLNVLTDPQFSTTTGPNRWQGSTRRVAPAMSVEELPSIDVVVISNNHYDLLDEASVKAIAAKSNPLFIVPLGVDAILREWGVSNVRALDWWEQIDVATKTGVQVQIHCVPMHGWSKRGWFSANDALWAGYVVKSGDFSVLYAGETGYGPDFKTIGEKFAALDMALLPVGGYEPRWYRQPMALDPTQAVQAYKDLGAKRAVALHWGSFDLSTETIDAARTELPKAVAAAGVSPDDFLVMQNGETAIWRVEKAPDLAGSSRAHPKREWRKGEPR